MIENEGSYYLYRHIRLDTGEPFYIGIGTKFTDRAYTYKGIYIRAFVKSRRNNFWKSIVNKTDYEIEILLESDDYEFIKQKEIEFIALYGRRDLGKGTLVNHTDGGGGIPNLKISKSYIEKIKKIKIGISENFYKDRIFPTKQGGDIQVIKYENHTNVIIRFLEGGEERCVSTYDILRGVLKNNFKPFIFDVGYLGGKIHNRKAYTTWYTLLKTNLNKYGICKEWLNFQNFEKWYNENYKENIMKEWVLCTNLLENNKEECHNNNCYYLPIDLSNQFKKCKGYFKSKEGRISANVNKKHIGYFKTIEEAIEKYKEVKKNYIINLANEYKNIFSEELYNKILNYEIRIKN